MGRYRCSRALVPPYTLVYAPAMTAQQIQRLRHRTRLSQAKFAAIVGVAANTVARWERGEMQMSPALDKLVRLTVSQAAIGGDKKVGMRS